MDKSCTKNQHDRVSDQTFFGERVINVWNDMPADTVDFTSLANFYRAMLCIRGTSHGPVSVCLSVRPSQVGVLLKRLNVGSHKQHQTIAQGF